jgi:hypothetical protein
MNKTVFDVEDIREIRHRRAVEYGAMGKEEAQKLRNERVEEELRKIAQFRFIARSIDVCPNDIKAMEAHKDASREERWDCSLRRCEERSAELWVKKSAQR